MNTAEQSHVPLRFTEEAFPAGTHKCLIYSNEEERAKTIARFLGSGVAAGERVTDPIITTRD